MSCCNAFLPCGTSRLLASLLLVLCASSLLAADVQPKLAIVSAGVQQVEDGPFVSSEFSFVPGDYVHFAFQVTGLQNHSRRLRGRPSIGSHLSTGST